METVMNKWKFNIRDIVRIAGTDIYGRVTNLTVRNGRWFVEVDDGRWYPEHRVLIQPSEKVAPGDIVKVAGMFAHVRWLIQDGPLRLVNTTEGTWDERDVEVAR